MAFFEKQNPAEMQINKQISADLEFINNKYTDIGRYVKLNLADKIDDMQVKSMIAEIDSTLQNLQQLNEQLRYVRGVKICPQCNSEIELNVLFCPFCGTKQNIPQHNNFAAQNNYVQPQNNVPVQNNFVSQPLNVGTPEQNNIVNTQPTVSETTIIEPTAEEIPMQTEVAEKTSPQENTAESVIENTEETPVVTEAEAVTEPESNNEIQTESSIIEETDVMKTDGSQTNDEQTVQIQEDAAAASAEISIEEAKTENEPQPQKPEFIFCSQCGSKEEADSKFCSNCGSRLL